MAYMMGIYKISEYFDLSEIESFRVIVFGYSI
jgi:hypothetical protein